MISSEDIGRVPEPSAEFSEQPLEGAFTLSNEVASGRVFFQEVRSGRVLAALA
jgi:hypothetical protein